MRRPIHQITVSPDASRATVHTRVDLLYRKFLEEVGIEQKNDEMLFDAHLKVIIWGVLYIEGLVNFKLYSFTASKLSMPDLIDSYWSLTKQARIEDKLDVVFAADHVKRPWLKETKKKFLKVVEVRNRLIHFKDVPTAFEFSTLRAKLETNAPLAKWVEHAPNPRIVADLFSVPLEDRKKLFQSLGDALERIQTG